MRTTSRRTKTAATRNVPHTDAQTGSRTTQPVTKKRKHDIRPSEEAPITTLRDLIEKNKLLLESNKKLNEEMQHRLRSERGIKTEHVQKLCNALKDNKEAHDEWMDVSENMIKQTAEFFDDEMETELRYNYKNMRRMIRMAPAPISKLDLVNRAVTEVTRVCREFADPEMKRIWKQYILPIWKEEDVTVSIPPLSRETCLEIATSGEVSKRALIYRLLLGPSTLLFGESDEKFATRVAFMAKWQEDARSLVQTARRLRLLLLRGPVTRRQKMTHIMKQHIARSMAWKMHVQTRRLSYSEDQ